MLTVTSGASTLAVYGPVPFWIADARLCDGCRRMGAPATDNAAGAALGDADEDADGEGCGVSKSGGGGGGVVWSASATSIAKNGTVGVIRARALASLRARALHYDYDGWSLNARRSGRTAD